MCSAVILPRYYQETERQYNRVITFLFGKQITGCDSRGVMWYEDHLFNGLKDSLRLGLRDGVGHIIGLKPEAQMGLNIAGPYKHLRYFQSENKEYSFVTL